MNSRTTVPVAIVGMACRFPGGADTLPSFWQIISNGTDCIEPIPTSRFDPRLLNRINTPPECEYAKVGGFVHDIDLFDASLFGISPREAVDIDPQQRMLLELTWRCMEDAAIDMDTLRKVNTATYVGVINHDYERMMLSNRRGITAYTSLGRSASIASNRISYCFDFSGPSVTVDTACSSSLTAVDTAFHALGNKSIDAAFAGGANVILLPDSFIEFSQASMLSKFGACQAFDNRADGFVRAEGAGMVLLKRLSDALIDGDNIHAVILASSINQDGRTAGIMAPSVAAQKSMMLSALEASGLDRNAIGYVEAHGTGTQVGDKAEATSLGEVYGKKQLPIGSVKTNIGHTEAAAGIAGLIKATLAIKNHQIPPNIHFHQPNVAIDFDSLGIRIPVELEPWLPTENGLRTAAVNSFGFGGANAHAIIQQAPEPINQPSKPLTHTLLLPLTSRCEQGLESRIAKVTSEIDLKIMNQLCHTATSMPKARYRNAFPFVADSSNNISKYIPVPPDLAINNKELAPSNLKVVFVFNGLSMAVPNAGVELYATEPVFKSVVDNADTVFGQNLDIRNAFAGKQSFQPDRVVQTHAFHFTLQVAICELWQSWGIVPDAVVGHSIGEIAAACTSGRVSLPDAAQVIIKRAKLLEKFYGCGLMLATAASSNDIEALIQDMNETTCVAAINSSISVTLAGTSEAIYKIAQRLKSNGVFHRILDLPIPFHSPIIDAAGLDVRKFCKMGIQKDSPIHWFSSVFGSAINKPLDDDFWWLNFRHPVHFANAFSECASSGYKLFIEVGPHASLRYDMTQCLQNMNHDGIILSSLNKNQKNSLSMRIAAGKLFRLGFELDWTNINPKSEKCDFPGIKLNRKSYWKSSAMEYRSNPIKNIKNNYALLSSATTSQKFTQIIPLNTELWPWLKHHKFSGQTIFPAAGYVELALELLHTHSIESFEIESLSILSMLSANDTQSIAVEIESVGQDGSFEFRVTDNSKLSNSTTYCTGSAKYSDKTQPSLNLSNLERNCFKAISADSIHHKLDQLGVEGDVTTWRVEKLNLINDSELLTCIQRVSIDEHVRQNYLLDPSLLDMCIRSAYTLCGDKLYLPNKIEKLQYWPTNSTVNKVYCHIKLHSAESSKIKLSMAITSVDNQLVIAKLNSVVLHALRTEKRSSVSNPNQLTCAQPSWALSAKLNRNISPFNKYFRSVNDKLEEFIALRTEQLDRKQHYKIESEWLTQITLASIGKALQETGFNKINKPVSLNELISGCNIENSQLPFFHALLELLTTHGYLELESSNTFPSIKLLKPLLVEPNKLINKFLNSNESAEYVLETALIERCSRKLPKVLRGEMSGLDAVFPNGSIANLQNFYLSSPTCRIYNETVQRSVELTLRMWSLDRPCRILEVGGGTGAMLSYLLPILKEHSVEYTFTDISRRFQRKLDSKYRGYSFVKFDLLDIDSDPFTQGFQPHHYDMIIAFDTLHLAHSIEQTLSYLKQLMTSGGICNIIEITNEPAWAKIVFGMLPGWWKQNENGPPSKSTCRPAAEWSKLFQDGSFEIVSELSDQINSRDGQHTVFILRKPENQDTTEHYVAPTDINRLIFSDCGKFSKQISNLFSENQTVSVTTGQKRESKDGNYVIRRNHPQDMDDLLDELQNLNKLPNEIFLLWNFAKQTSCDKSIDDNYIDHTVYIDAMHLIQVYDKKHLKLPHIKFITSNAYNIDNTINPIDCLQATIWGFANTLRNEFLTATIQLIDVDSTCPASVHKLLELLASNSKTAEIAIRKSGVYVPTLRKLNLNSFTASEEHNRKLDYDEYGDLRPLNSKGPSLPVLAESEVIIEVESAALNFRDVMLTLDHLPKTAFREGMMGQSIGMECAGKVASVGSKVSHVAIGDSVVALAPNAFARFVTADRQFVLPVKNAKRLEQIAGVSVAYITAYCCFDILSDLQPGDSILIHSAAGGVGLGLLKIAKKLGLKIFATAGNSQKRSLLSQVGVDSVCTSRDNSFVEHFNELTDHLGIDCIINTLGSELALANRELLKTGGHFIELGKYVERDSVLKSIQLSNPTASIHTIDIDKLWRDQPDVIERYFRKVTEKIENNELPYLPYQSFPANTASEAFRHMTRAHHFGKVLLQFDQIEYTNSYHKSNSMINSEASYLIVGGSRGFGLATALWLCQHGAKNLVIASRNAEKSNPLKSALPKFNSMGVRLEVINVDITDFGALQTQLSSVKDRLPPIRGVIHSAMDIEDRSLINLDQSSYRNVSAAKILGAWNLHRATKSSQLDFFALYSSVTSIFAPPGQSAYTSANCFLDSFANYLKQQGIRAISINWGAVSDHGHVSDHPDKVLTLQEKFGINPLPANQLLEPLLGILQRDDLKQIVIAGRESINSTAKEPNMANNNLDESSNQSGRNPTENPEKNANAIVQCISEALDINPTELDPDEPIINFGIDSLLAVELSHMLRAKFEIQVSAASVLDQITANQIAQQNQTRH